MPSTPSLEALAFAAECRTGRQGTDPDRKSPGRDRRPRSSCRVDVSALRRGHTMPGETCEIDGLGPIPVETLREFFPQAAIDLIVTDGVDVFNVTHFGRRANARQQVVLDWIGGECTRRGCTATRHLQVDHRIDWAKIKITELRNLDWLCVSCHRLQDPPGLGPCRGRAQAADGAARRPGAPQEQQRPTRQPVRSRLSHHLDDPAPRVSAV